MFIVGEPELFVVSVALLARSSVTIGSAQPATANAEISPKKMVDFLRNESVMPSSVAEMCASDNKLREDIPVPASEN